MTSSPLSYFFDSGPSAVSLPGKRESNCLIWCFAFLLGPDSSCVIDIELTLLNFHSGDMV